MFFKYLTQHSQNRQVRELDDDVTRQEPVTCLLLSSLPQQGILGRRLELVKMFLSVTHGSMSTFFLPWVQFKMLTFGL